MKLSQKSIDDRVSPFFADWEELSKTILHSFETAGAGSAEWIGQGHALYRRLKETLYGLFGEQMPLPINEKERLEFVLATKSAHAAFRQLSQLFTELKKKIARHKIGYPAD